MNGLDDITLRVQVAAALAGVRPCIPDVRRRVAECVSALNPYGCNQYGEGWAHPHNGNSTAYKRMSPFDKHAPKRKVLTSEREESTTEEVTNKRHVGKGDIREVLPPMGPGTAEAVRRSRRSLALRRTGIRKWRERRSCAQIRIGTTV